MTRLSRHTVVVLLVALVSCVGGMSVAVVAFGQAGGDPDATVPTGDFTGTTPPQSISAQTGTSTLGNYGTTTPTVATPTVTTPSTTPTTPTSTGQSTPATTNGGRAKTPSPPSSGNSSRTASSAPPPSKATRNGPARLAFTGGEPIIIGTGGLAFMLAGLGLHLRRLRQGEPPPA